MKTFNKSIFTIGTTIITLFFVLTLISFSQGTGATKSCKTGTGDTLFSCVCEDETNSRGNVIKYYPIKESDGAIKCKSNKVERFPISETASENCNQTGARPKTINSDGEVTDCSFDKIFSATEVRCEAGQVFRGFDNNGTPVCSTLYRNPNTDRNSIKNLQDCSNREIFIKRGNSRNCASRESRENNPALTIADPDTYSTEGILIFGEDEPTTRTRQSIEQSLTTSLDLVTEDTTGTTATITLEAPLTVKGKLGSSTKDILVETDEYCVGSAGTNCRSAEVGSVSSNSIIKITEQGTCSGGFTNENNFCYCSPYSCSGELTSPPISFCKISGSSCPAGWIKKDNWTRTTAKTCSSTTSCRTGSHTFSNKEREICHYTRTVTFRGQPVSGTQTCRATITEIGCKKRSSATISSDCSQIGGTPYNYQ